MDHGRNSGQWIERAVVACVLLLIAVSVHLAGGFGLGGYGAIQRLPMDPALKVSIIGSVGLLFCWRIFRRRRAMTARRRNFLLLAVSSTMLGAAYLQPARDTYMFSLHARALSVLAVRDDASWTLNPAKWDCLLITPDTAMWILTHLEYPYKSCPPDFPHGSCDVSLIAWVGRGTRIGSPESRQRAWYLLEYLVRRGESVNIPTYGTPPLHSAISDGDVELARFLLSAGADPTQRISESSYEYFDNSRLGLNAYELAAKLEAENPARFAPVHSALKQGVR
jgi:hypothetical protein